MSLNSLICIAYHPYLDQKLRLSEYMFQDAYKMERHHHLGNFEYIDCVDPKPNVLSIASNYHDKDNR